MIPFFPWRAQRPWRLRTLYSPSADLVDAQCLALAWRRQADLFAEGDEAWFTGDEVSMHYTGCLLDQDAPGQRGQQFDSSRGCGEPLVFRLGAGRVIRGWDDGIAGMRRGGRRELLIPSSFGYGARGAGKVTPPGASPVFEVALLEIRKSR